jgi:hypothetical protein
MPPQLAAFFIRRHLPRHRSRVTGQPETSTDGFHPYRVAIRDTFGDSTSHGVIPVLFLRGPRNEGQKQRRCMSQWQ